MSTRLLTGLLLLTVLPACIPPADEATLPPLNVDIDAPLTRQVAEWQNNRRQDSLLLGLGDDDASLRFLSARALASFPTLSDAVIDSLLSLLSDPVEEVRTQAAYALGQTGNPRVAAGLAAGFDRTAASSRFDAALLEAVGKTGDAASVADLAAISTYTLADTALMAGRAWGLYYAALRGNRSLATDAVMVELVLSTDAASEIRHPAAHYLQRISFPVDSVQERGLRKELRNTRDPIVAMGVIRTLGRSGSGAARLALLRRMETTADWRERVEVLLAFSGFEYATVRESVIEALRDRHPLVARTAADFFLGNGVETDAPLYLQLAQDPLPNHLELQLYRAANRHLSPFLGDYRDRINADLRTQYAALADPYAKADALRALGEFPWMYRAIYGYYQETEVPVVRTAAAETLQAISDRSDFDDFFRGNSRRVRGELAAYFQQMIEGREEGPAYHAALALTESPTAYQPYYSDLTWLDAALAGFDLPRQLETYTVVFSARNALKGTTESLPALDPARVRPIDWKLLREDGPRTVDLTTEQGTFSITLWPAVAPATVSSFLELVNRGYYDDKVFHRVVPNFVAQGGGPRGDGFGSEDFVVRTETPYLHWDRAGLVGMASAGKDTEGVQFFITHRPTPHLDGKYTIFGEVTEGQDVVDRLLPGSRITRVELR